MFYLSALRVGGGWPGGARCSLFLREQRLQKLEWEGPSPKCSPRAVVATEPVPSSLFILVWEVGWEQLPGRRGGQQVLQQPECLRGFVRHSQAVQSWRARGGRVEAWSCTSPSWLVAALRAPWPEQQSPGVTCPSHSSPRGAEGPPEMFLCQPHRACPTPAFGPRDLPLLKNLTNSLLPLGS